VIRGELTTLTHGLVIGVVMAINEIGQFTMVRSSSQIQQKSTKKEKEDTHSNGYG
jgi:hypothetical protein